MRFRPLRFWPFYAVWIAICAILFFALSGAEDPSRRKGRILSNDAGRQALAAMRAQDRDRFRDYEVVHVAAERGRWIVLLDKVPHTGLAEAVVVEVDGSGGRVVGVRRVKR